MKKNKLKRKLRRRRRVNLKGQLISERTAKMTNNVIDFAVHAGIIAKLPEGPGKEVMEFGVDLLQESITIVSDENPDNSKQLISLLKEFANKEILPIINEKAKTAINGIEKPILAQAVSPIVEHVLSSLPLMLDDNPNDGQQLENHWINGFVQNNEIQEKLFYALLFPTMERMFGMGFAEMMGKMMLEQIDRLADSIGEQKAEEMTLKLNKQLDAFAKAA